MKGKFILYVLVLVLSFSCKEKESDSKQKIEISKNTQLQQLIQQVLSSEQLESYLRLMHKDTTLRLYMVNDKSLGITSEIKLKKFNEDIKIIDFETIKKKDITSYIRFEKLEIKDNKALVKLYYEAKGLGFEGEYNFINNTWVNIRSDTWQN